MTLGGTTGARRGRVASIDVLRGVVMLLMALDHVRDMTTPPIRGADFSQAGAALFFTRWITHFCAPTFVLLAGVSASLYGTTRSTRDTARFLFTRGLWLVFMEITVVNWAWSFRPFSGLGLQVIWAIGCSMIVLSLLVRLPRAAIAGIGAVLVLGHNLLDGVQPSAADASALWQVLHIPGLLAIAGQPIAFVAYPLIPWVGVMALGYAIGPYFLGENPNRPRRLVCTGLALTAAFVGLRAFNPYGDPSPWDAWGDPISTLVSFLNTTKYPPSLQFLLMTLGPALALLGALERAGGRFVSVLATIGRVPFFYYVVHLYLVHTLALFIGVAQGFRIRDIAVMFFDYPRGFGVDLSTAYVLWVAVVLALYPACAWFAAVKKRRRDWWLSYL